MEIYILLCILQLSLSKYVYLVRNSNRNPINKLRLNIVLIKFIGIVMMTWHCTYSDGVSNVLLSLKLSGLYKKNIFKLKVIKIMFYLQTSFLTLCKQCLDAMSVQLLVCNSLTYV